MEALGGWEEVKVRRARNVVGNNIVDTRNMLSIVANVIAAKQFSIHTNEVFALQGF